jgi:Na+-driven multidrug efflux pump
MLASCLPGRSHAHMFAHITPLEAPIVWFAFAAGITLGAAACYLWTQRVLKRS